MLDVGYEADILAVLVDLLLGDSFSVPVDLSRRVVLIPQPIASSRLRRLLLDACQRRGNTALIPPVIDSIQGWAKQFFPGRTRILTDAERELLLLEAIREFPTLAANSNAWTFVHNTLELFDELNANAVSLSANLPDFIKQLAGSYGVEDLNLRPLSDEASLVHRLWHAWREQLRSINAVDESEAVAEGLNASHSMLANIEMIYLAGHYRLSGVESAWATRIHVAGKLAVINQSGTIIGNGDNTSIPKPPLLTKSEYTQILDQAYASPELSISTRIRETIARMPDNPASQRLRIYTAENPEDEASAIDLQIRKWILDGKQHIGIVTNDRRLARRVRALLERSTIRLDDATGWPLSTTSAATILDRLLEAIEIDFPHDVLLDLLRSPFIEFADRDSTLISASRLEVAIFDVFSIHSGLEAYKRSLRRFQESLDQRFGHGETTKIIELLSTISRAVGPLQKLLHTRNAKSPIFFDALFHCLETAGIAEKYHEDDAGRQLLELLEEMRAAAYAQQGEIDWFGFRAWIRGSLERRDFKLIGKTSGIEIRSFNNCRFNHYDALVIAGATRDYLPGSEASVTFFNDAVRRDLGLRTSSNKRQELFRDYRRLLEAAPEVLLTLSRENHADHIPVSPWVERLRLFISLAYGSNLEAIDLKLLRSAVGPLVYRDDSSCPSPSCHPLASMPSQLPNTFTASTYQSLIDCPYQYFARHCLKLTPFDSIEQEMEKSDYGKRVHRILHLFHCESPAFSSQLMQDSVVAARRRIHEITERIFNPDITHNVSARAWMHRWKRNIEEYLSWQSRRADKWTVHACEVELTHMLSNQPEFILHGKIDRIDSSNGKYSLIDYKTGALPGIDDIRMGENIQLVFYAILLNSREFIEQNPGELIDAFFLKIDGGDIQENIGITKDRLDKMLDAELTRIHMIVSELQKGASLPAWGDSSVCTRCEMPGLCRKSYWTDDPVASHVNF